MADKMTCPGCNSHSSSVLADFDRGDPCRFCGLSAEAALEIIEVRARRANEAVQSAYEESRLRLDKADRELARTRKQLEAVKYALEFDEEGDPW